MEADLSAASPPMLRAIRFVSLADVPADVWDSLDRQDSLFVSRRWSRTLMRSNPDVPVEFWAVRDENGWLVGVPVHRYPRMPARSAYNVWALHSEEFVPATGGGHEARPHVLIGTRNGQRGGFLRAGRNREGAEAALLRAVADGHPDAVISMLYLERTLLDPLRASLPGWHARFVEVAAGLDVPAGGRDLGAFIDDTDKGTRRRIRAELRQAEGTGCRRVDGPAEIDALAPRLAPLLVKVHQRHGETADETGMVSYIRACANSGLEPQVFLVGDEEDPLAFSLCVRDGSLLSVRIVGLDHDQVFARHSGDYARVCIYEPLLFAMNSGVERVDLGTGSLHAKLLRGARVEPLYGITRLPDGLPVTLRETDVQRRVEEISAMSARLDSALVRRFMEWPGERAAGGASLLAGDRPLRM